MASGSRDAAFQEEQEANNIEIRGAVYGNVSDLISQKYPRAVVNGSLYEHVERSFTPESFPARVRNGLESSAVFRPDVRGEETGGNGRKPEGFGFVSVRPVSPIRSIG